MSDAPRLAPPGGGATAIVLVSGGLDSCVTAALAACRHRLAMLHASYGQRTAAREREAFEAIADHYGVAAERRLHVDLTALARLGGSALTDPRIAVPRGEPRSDGAIPATYVPFRNAHLLATAVSWAEVLPASSIWIGAVEEDSSGYPDCRESFLDAFAEAVRRGARDGASIAIEAPLVHMSKEAIVRRGLELGAPLHLTWSCYERSDLACGACESCRLRRRAFARAGVSDPIRYAS